MIHILYVGHRMGMEKCFGHVPDQNKIFFKAHCLMLQNGKATTGTCERIYTLSFQDIREEKERSEIRLRIVLYVNYAYFHDGLLIYKF